MLPIDSDDAKGKLWANGATTSSMAMELVVERSNGIDFMISGG